MHDLSQLTDEEIEQVKNHLKGLINRMKSKKGVGSLTSLLPEEEFILNSLQRPERGDVLVSVLRSPGGLQIFISNRRDPDNPFSVMSYEESRKYSGRRLLGGMREDLGEGELGLFIITAQDREMLKTETRSLFHVYSLSFQVGEERLTPGVADEGELKTKPLTHLKESEKWTVYKRNWEFDNRLQDIAKDLFGFLLTYSPYNQPAREELIYLFPEKYKERVARLVKDIYPYSVRVVLRKDFLQDHNKKLDEVRETMKSLLNKIQKRAGGSGLHPEYSAFLREVEEHLSDIITTDPELSRFV